MKQQKILRNLLLAGVFFANAAAAQIQVVNINLGTPVNVEAAVGLSPYLPYTRTAVNVVAIPKDLATNKLIGGLTAANFDVRLLEPAGSKCSKMNITGFQAMSGVYNLIVEFDDMSCLWSVRDYLVHVRMKGGYIGNDVAVAPVR
jgi:hypothetical protein